MILIQDECGELTVEVNGDIISVGDEFIGGIKAFLNQIAKQDTGIAQELHMGLIQALSQIELGED